jgi:glutathione S-transferase
MEEISLYGSNGKPDWFLKLNPKGTVPVLVSHGGAAVYPDSDVVLDQYEAGNLKGMTPIYPPGDRQDVRECIKTWRNRINAMLPDGKAAVLGGDMTAALQQHLAIMNKAVEGPYLASQRVTTADCHAFPFVWRLSQEYPSAFEKDFTALRDWLDLCGEQTAFARTIQPNWWWWW